MLRKYVVMLPLHEHAHTGLLFGRIRHSRIYAFDMRGCFSFIQFACVSASYGIRRTMEQGNNHQLNVFQIT